jgi:ribosomal protein S18 acetylase RimI-like enzyme
MQGDFQLTIMRRDTMGTDMLVKLYDLDTEIAGIQTLAQQGVTIKRAFPPDKQKITDYIKQTFNSNWANECDVAFSNKPVSCFIAVKDKQVIGFACYDATARGFFGPMGVSTECRGSGIGEVLLLKCLHAMREEGYGYAIIGWVEEAIKFYEKTVNATVIADSFPGIFSRMIDQ